MGKNVEVLQSNIDLVYAASVAMAQSFGVAMTAELSEFMRHHAKCSATQEATIMNLYKILHPNAVGLEVIFHDDGMAEVTAGDISVVFDSNCEIDGNPCAEIRIWRCGEDTPEACVEWSGF